jgi:hypothetical protein
MRFLLLVPCFLFLGLSLSEAQIQFGFKGGLSTTDVNVDELEVLQMGGGDRLRLALEEARYGVHAGVMLRIPLGKTLLLQPEVVFNSNTVEFMVDDLSQQGSAGMLLEEKYQYLDIPFLLGAKLGPLRLMAGPEGRVFIDSASDLFEFENYDQTFEDLTVSFLAGAGLDLWNLTLDVRYEGNFDNFGDHINFAGQQYEFNQSESRWIFSVGFFLGR